MEKKVIRYTLVLPEQQFNSVKEAADARGTTVVDLFRRFLKLGLTVMDAEDKGGCLVERREGKDKEICLF